MKRANLVSIAFFALAFVATSGMNPAKTTATMADTVFIAKELDSNLQVIYTIKIDTIATDTLDRRRILPDGYIFTADALVAYAKEFIGTPYRYSAKGPSAFDCSGFTRYVFRKFGYVLENSSRNQYRSSVWKSVQRDSLMAGDLVFFGSRGSSSSVGHVGIVTSVDAENGNFSFIHASTSLGVCVTNFAVSPYYVKRYIGAKRVLPEYDKMETEGKYLAEIADAGSRGASESYVHASDEHLNILNADKAASQQAAETLRQATELKEAVSPRQSAAPASVIANTSQSSAGQNHQTNTMANTAQPVNGQQPSVQTESSAPEYYTVVKGDTLYRISKVYNISLKALCAMNGIMDANAHKLQIGDRLRVK